MNGFKEEDVQKLAKFNNFVNQHATFNITTAELVEYYKLLAWFQSELTPKVRANILEIKAIHESEESSEGDS